MKTLTNKLLVILFFAFAPLQLNALVIDTGDYYFDSDIDGANIVGKDVTFLHPSLSRNKSYFDLVESKYWDDGYRFASSDQYYHLFNSATGFDLNKAWPDAPMAYDVDEKGYSVLLDLLGMREGEALLYDVDNSLTKPLKQDFTYAEQMDFLFDSKFQFGSGIAFLPNTTFGQDLYGVILMAKVIDSSDIEPIITSRAFPLAVSEPPVVLLLLAGLLSLLSTRRT